MKLAIGESTKSAIVDQFARYCRQVLEKPVSAFGDKPACPFSRREREADKIQYEFCAIEATGPSPDVVKAVGEFGACGRYTTLLVIDPQKRVTVEQAVAYGLELSRQCRPQQIVAIALHPDDDYDIDGFQPRHGAPYVSMLCQAAAYLRQAKQQLVGTGYYARWSQAALRYNFEQIGQFLQPIDDPAGHEPDGTLPA